MALFSVEIYHSWHVIGTMIIIHWKLCFRPIWRPFRGRPLCHKNGVPNVGLPWDITPHLRVASWPGAQYPAIDQMQQIKEFSSRNMSVRAEVYSEKKSMNRFIPFVIFDRTLIAVFCPVSWGLILPVTFAGLSNDIPPTDGIFVSMICLIWPWSFPPQLPRIQGVHLSNPTRRGEWWHCPFKKSSQFAERAWLYLIRWTYI